MKQQPSSPVLINGVTLSLTNAQVERLLLAAKTLWYALPDIERSLGGFFEGTDSWLRAHSLLAGPDEADASCWTADPPYTRKQGPRGPRH